VRIAVLTVSDTRGLADDRSGDLLVERLTAAGHRLATERYAGTSGRRSQGACGPGSRTRAWTWSYRPGGRG
jgi:hypothetical protein